MASGQPDTSAQAFPVVLTAHGKRVDLFDQAEVTVGDAFGVVGEETDPQVPVAVDKEIGMVVGGFGKVADGGCKQHHLAEILKDILAVKLTIISQAPAVVVGQLLFDLGLTVR
jgi:hypothetical protein